MSGANPFLAFIAGTPQEDLMRERVPFPYAAGELTPTEAHLSLRLLAGPVMYRRRGMTIPHSLDILQPVGARVTAFRVMVFRENFDSVRRDSREGSPAASSLLIQVRNLYKVQPGCMFENIEIRAQFTDKRQ